MLMPPPQLIHLWALVMTAFAVYGVSRHAIRARFMEKVSRWEDRPGGKRRWLSEDEWLNVIEHLTDQAFEKARPVRIGNGFDAPQYAERFIALADTKNFHSLHIRAAYRDEKRLTRSGHPTLTWVTLQELYALQRGEAA